MLCRYYATLGSRSSRIGENGTSIAELALSPYYDESTGVCVDPVVVESHSIHGSRRVVVEWPRGVSRGLIHDDSEDSAFLKEVSSSDIIAGINAFSQPSRCTFNRGPFPSW